MAGEAREEGEVFRRKRRAVSNTSIEEEGEVTRFWKQDTRGTSSGSQNAKKQLEGNLSPRARRGEEHQPRGGALNGREGGSARPTFASLLRDKGLFTNAQEEGKEAQISAMAQRWANQEERGAEESRERQGEGHQLCPELHLSKEAVLELSKPWWGSLIVKVLGRRVNFQFLSERLRASWRPAGEMKLMTLGADFFLVQLADWQDRARVINNGPWAVFGHHLSVREWTPEFVPHTATIDRAVVWARIPGLPLEYYDHSCLRMIGERLGKVIRIDADTESSVKGRFARLCIEVDLQQSLIAHFKLNGKTFNVEYEGIQLVCFDCGKVGHRRDGCPSRSPATTQPEGEGRAGGPNDAPKSNEGTPTTGMEEGDLNTDPRVRDTMGHHGPWMSVGPRRRKGGRGGERGGNQASFNRKEGDPAEIVVTGEEKRKPSAIEREKGKGDLRPGVGTPTSSPTDQWAGGPGRIHKAHPKIPIFQNPQLSSPQTGRVRGLAQGPRKNLRTLKEAVRGGPRTNAGSFSSWEEATANFAGFNAKAMSHTARAAHQQGRDERKEASQAEMIIGASTPASSETTLQEELPSTTAGALSTSITGSGGSREAGSGHGAKGSRPPDDPMSEAAARPHRSPSPSSSSVMVRDKAKQASVEVKVTNRGGGRRVLGTALMFRRRP